MLTEEGRGALSSRLLHPNPPLTSPSAVLNGGVESTAGWHPRLFKFQTAAPLKAMLPCPHP